MPSLLSFSSSFGNMLTFGNSFCALCIAHAVDMVYTCVKPLCLTVDIASRCMWFNTTKFSGGIVDFQDHK